MKIRMIRKRLISAFLAVLMLFSCAFAVSCSSELGKIKEPILECGDREISLSFYEFLLSRMKGELARSGYDVTSESFWSSDSGVDGKTYEEYFNESILENCKIYLASLVLFDEMELELPESVYTEIDEEIDFYISYDGNDSEDSLNGILADLGVDTVSLRQAYIIESMIEYLQLNLYGENASMIGDKVKEEYYSENYCRFKQILVANYYYEYEKDAEGNTIYFDPETGEPMYDKENGYYMYDDNGNMIRDEYGNVIYYGLGDGRILYDTVNGVRSPEKDANGEGIRVYYTEEQMAEREARARELCESVSKGNTAAFEAEMEKNNDAASGAEEFADGYYLSDIESAGYEQYMLDILEKLKEMDEGDIDVVESEYGYHVIMKYELNEGAWSDSQNDTWFESFNSSLTSKLFLDRCEKIIPDIEEIGENLSKARSIRELGINYDY